MSVCRWLSVLPFAPIFILFSSVKPGQAEGLPAVHTQSNAPIQWVQFNPDNPNGRSEWINQLNLSNDQVQRLRRIAQQFRPQIQQRKQTLNQLRADLRAMMSGSASSSEIRDKYRQIEALQQEIRRIHFDSIMTMREVLTPEQRRQVEVYMRNRYQGGGKRPYRHNPLGL